MGLMKSLTLPLQNLTKSLTTMRFGTSTQISPWTWMPRSQRNYARDVGDGSGNSALMAAIFWICRNFPEATFTLTDRVSGDNIPDHPLLDLLEAPNPRYSGELLLMATLVDFSLMGNAYWIKLRNKVGAPVQLWWVPQSLITPIPHPTQFIAHYEYRPDGEKVQIIQPEDIIHFRFGLDPRNPRKGMAPITSLLREIFTDDEAANFTASILANLGMPGVIISPASMPGSSFQMEMDGDAIKDEFKQRFGGDNRGEPMILSAPTDVKILSWSPSQMDLKTLRRIPEERVSAIMGISAMVTGLGAGLEHSTYSNYEEAKAAAWENNLVPTGRLLSAEIKNSLLPDFGQDPKRIKASFDTSNVKALSENTTEVAKRADLGVRGGWITVSEGRQQLGLEVDESHDIYLRPSLVIPTKLDNLPLIPPRAPTPPREDDNGGLLDEDEEDLDDGEELEVPQDQPKRSRALKAPSDFGKRWRESIEEGSRPLASSLRNYFYRQAFSVGARWIQSEGLAEADELIPDSDTKELEMRLLVAAEGVVSRTDSILSSLMGRKGLHLKADPYDLMTAADLIDEIGSQIVGINEVTRQHIADILLTARAAGESLYEIADRLQGVVIQTYRDREMNIARTELGRMQNLLAADRYKSRRVKYVEILDGEGCLPEGQIVEAGDIRQRFTRWFEGPVIVLSTAANDKLTCTPKHPILTDKGWVFASELREGDYVVRALGGKGVTPPLSPLLDQYIDHVYAPIEEITGSHSPLLSEKCGCVIPANGDLYINGSDQKVQIVDPYSDLSTVRDSVSVKESGEVHFVLATEESRTLPPCSGSDKRLPICGLTTNSRVSGGSSSEPFFGGLKGCGEGVCLCSSASGESEGFELSEEDAPLLPSTHDLHRRLAGLVELVELTHIESVPFAGHVYNLRTGEGWYLANGIVTHNCGWTSHDDTDLAHGSVREMSEFEGNPLAHPRCVRVPLPIVEQ